MSGCEGAASAGNVWCGDKSLDSEDLGSPKTASGVTGSCVLLTSLSWPQNVPEAQPASFSPENLPLATLLLFSCTRMLSLQFLFSFF